MGIARLFTQPVSVETYQGSGSLGDVYTAPVTRTVFVNDARKLVRDTAGSEIVSSTTIYDTVDSVDNYTPGTRVTVNGRPARVITAYRRDSAGPTSIHHTQVDLM